MIASLMMYQRPELAGAHDRFWALIRRRLVDAPEHLSQDADPFDVWGAPDLVLSQTCGMPYRLRLHDKVQLVGTPDYGVQGCPPGYYRSALVVRADDPRAGVEDFRDAVFAYNEAFSQSGYAAPYAHLQPFGFWFENRVQSHAHLQSAKAVAEASADIASLDAVSWRLIEQHEGFAGALRVLDWTVPTPGLPLITGKDQDRAAIFDAVAAAIDDLQTDDRTLLGLRGLVAIPKADYLAVPSPDGGGS